MQASKAVRRIVASCVVLAVAFVMACPTVVAQSSWTAGDGGNGLFNNTLNWTSGTAPVAGSSLVFGATSGTTALTNDLSIAGNNPLWAGITFNAAAPAYTISGSAMTMAASSAITNNSTNTQTFSNAFAISSPLTMAASSGGLTFSGVLSGTGSITKTGTGTLTLSGNNTYTGLTTVSAGVLSLSGTSSIGNLVVGGSSTLTVTGGTTTVNATNGNTLFGGASGNNTALQINGGVLNIQGVGAWVAIGDAGGAATTTLTSGTYSNTTQWGEIVARNNAASNGTLNINGGRFYVSSTNSGGFGGLNVAHTGTGVVNLNGGVLEVDRLYKNAGNGTVYLNGGTLAVAPNVITDFMTGLTAAFVKSGGAIIDTATRSITIGQNLLADPVSSGGGLTKLGAGTLTLTGSSTYTGTTTISAGTLQVGNGGATGSLGSGNVLNNGALGFNRTTNLTVASVISGSGSLTKSGSNTLTLSGNNTYTGLTTVSAGVLSLSGTSSIGNLVVSGSSALTVTGGTTTVNATNGNTAFGGAFGNNTTLQINGGVLNIQGAGAWVTIGDNGGSATTTITSGTYSNTTQWGEIVARTSVASSGTINVNGGKFYVSSTNSSGFGGFNVGRVGTAVVNLNGGILEVDRLYKGDGTNGQGNGTIYLNGGTLAVAPNVITHFMTGLTAAYVKSGGAIIDTATRSITIGQNLLADPDSTGGGLTKLGAGTLTLTGSSTYTGETRVSAGVLALGAANAISNQSSLLVNGGGFNLAGFNDTVAGVTITSGSIFGAGTLTAATYNVGGGTVAANLGDGTLAVNGNSSLAGSSAVTAVNLNSGALTLGSGGRFTASSVAVSGSSGASLTLGGNEAFGSLAGAANVALGGSTLSVGSANTSTTFSGVLSNGALTKTGVGTLALTGNNTYSGLTTISGGTLAVGSGGTSGALAGNVLNNAALVFHRSDATTFANAISGSGLVRLLGGSLTLSGSNSFSGGTLIDGGTLLVNGSLASGVAAAANTMLGGSGVIGGTLSGAGLVSPGNSPGILTANAFDSTAGLDAAFEFTAFAPNYATSGTGALNDVLRLTSGSPFSSALTTSNTIDVYFNVDSIANGDVFEGGFFTGLSAAELLTNVQGATFRYWIKDNGGGTVFGGVNYSSLTSLPGITGLTVNSVSRTADFGGGNVVAGSVTQFIVVPEPGAIALAGVGIAIAGWSLRRRRTK